MKKALLYCLLILGILSPAFATDLMDIYQQALDSDPIFKEAYDNYMANTEAIPQARAALYPQIGIGSQAGRNFQDTKAFGFGTNQYYSNTIWQVTASQALFNYQAWAQVQQAKASVKAAQAVFNDAAQNLILRTAKAYFDVLFARDTLDFAEAKKKS